MIGAYLQSRVARRLFFLFIVAALVPAVTLALFAYVQVSGQFIELNHRRLRQDSKAQGMSLVERLRWRADGLARAAGEPGHAGPDGIPLPEGFRSLGEVSADRLARLSPSQRRHLDSGRVLLLVDGQGDQYMMLRLAEQSRTVQGTLDPSSLWEDPEAGAPYCVLGPESRAYYCSPELQGRLPRPLPTPGQGRNSGVMEWRGAGEQMLGAYWRALLNASYGHPGFVVVMAQPRRELLQSLDEFRALFPAVIVLALAVATWLALSQIRHQLDPLRRLLQGTRRIARGDFGTEIDVTGADEFGTLARSFNLMACRLRQKFHMLEELAELDRAILTSSGVDYLVQTILQRTHQAIACDCVGVLQLDDTARNGRLTVRAGGATGRSLVADVFLDKDARAALPVDRPWVRLQAGGPADALLRPLAGMGSESAVAFPVVLHGRVVAVLLLGYARLPEELDDIVQAGRGLSDRLALAVSNLAWEERLYHQAHYDALTDLPNRVLLRDRVEQAIARADREGHSTGLMLIDLDQFKQVNDTLGHSAGDALLVECARRLSGLMRRSDTIARLGGDEFILLLDDLPKGSETAYASAVADKVLAALKQPTTLAERMLAIDACIGIAIYPENADGFEGLLKSADAAMYEAKRNLRGSYRFYSSEMNAQAEARFNLAQDLREAFDKGEFSLVYQPKIEMRTGRIVGAEALLRWHSPKRGAVSPDLFIPVMEDIGLGTRLGEWVLETACCQIAEWDRQGQPAISISVNISPSQFQLTDMVETVRGALPRTGLPAHRLELEILEATAVDPSAHTGETLRRLRELDVHIALGDFGTGYSSLVYLTQLPATVLKIDRGFISSLATDARQQAIVERIISLAKALGLTVLAEGVEESEQWVLLRRMGCDLVQGYLCSRPLAPADFLPLLSGGHCPAVESLLG